MKRVLITGANSYVGESVKNYLLKFNNLYIVDVLDVKDANWVNFDFSKYDVIYHVAGIAHSDNGKVNKEKQALYKRVNVDLTVEVAKKAKLEKVKQFIFMSSIIVYGDSGKINKLKRINKETVCNPSNYYGESKLLAEQGLDKLSSDDFKVVVLRCPMIYGPNCKGNFVALSKLANKMLFIPNVKNERSMIYIDNLAEFVRLMIENNEKGTFYPQNKEYVNTCYLIKLLRQNKNKKTHLIKGTSWILSLMSHFTSLVNKAFGNLTYEKSMSEYKKDYQLISLEESIRVIENK